MYIIGNIGKYKAYFKCEIVKNRVFHFVADIDEAKKFKTKLHAKKMLEHLIKLREFNNLKIIKR